MTVLKNSGEKPAGKLLFMISKPKTCAGCNQSKIIWKNHDGKRYCKDCWFKFKTLNNVVTKITVDSNKPNYHRLKAVSDKQAQLLSAYSSLRRLYFSKPEHQFCKARLLSCSVDATEIHHMKGRGPWLMAMETWLPVCRACHVYIENNPEEARVLGFSKSRVEPTT